MDTDPSDVECWNTSLTPPNLIPGSNREEREYQGQLRSDRNTDTEALEDDESEQRELKLVKGSSSASLVSEVRLQTQVQGLARAVVQLKESMEQGFRYLSHGERNIRKHNGASPLVSPVGSTYTQREETETPRMPLP